MQTATSETESKSLDLSIYVHHTTLRAPCPKGQVIVRRSCCQILLKDHSDSLVLIVPRIVLRTVLTSE